MAEEWGGVEDAMEDPEEIRVIFCALDSFRQVLIFILIPITQQTMLTISCTSTCQPQQCTNETIASTPKMPICTAHIFAGRRFTHFRRRIGIC